VAGALKDMIHADGLADIIDFDYSPNGNNYYTTSECGASTSYSVDVRHCYNEKCGRDATNRPADCFTGTLVTQHGAMEGNMNRYLACAKNFESDTVKYFDFVDCMEEGYGQELDGVAQSCTQTFDFTSLKACYDGSDGDAAQAREAQNTPSHDGVPYVEIDGKQAQNQDLIGQVCSAYTGTKPAGCSALVV